MSKSILGRILYAFDLSLGFYLSICLAIFVLIHVLIARPLNRPNLFRLFLSLLSPARKIFDLK